MPRAMSPYTISSTIPASWRTWATRPSRYDPALVERMLAKLHALVEHEIGEDKAPFDLDLFGTRAVTYRRRPR